MDTQEVGSRALEPKAPHTFVERLSQPHNGLSGPYGAGPTGQGVAIAVRNGPVPDDCESCGRRRTDPIHEASERAADAEQWPL